MLVPFGTVHPAASTQAVHVGGGGVVVVSGGASTITGSTATYAHICPHSFSCAKSVLVYTPENYPRVN